MSTHKCLVITSRDDAHCDYVIDKFNEKRLGDRIVRLNTEDFLTNVSICFSNKLFRINILDSQREFSSQDVKSVWFRRPKQIKTDIYNDEGVETFVGQQANATLRGIYFCLHDSALWINSLPAMHRARIKLQQIFLANELGFNVPKTLVTNNPDEALSFFDTHQIVCNKSLDEPNYIIKNQLYPYLTKLIQSRREIEECVEAISDCPTLFQQYINKEFDVRVVVVGANIFSFEIHSQEDELSRVDFRGKSPNLLEHKAHNLPSELSSRLLLYMKRQGLVYSAFDLVYSKEGKYYFIENNCNGQWLWLELLTGAEISENLIHLMLFPNTGTTK